MHKLKFLNKVIQYLVEDTEVNYPKKSFSYCGNFITWSSGDILFPFMGVSRLNFSNVSYILRYDKPFPFFYEYCKDTYSLTEGEIEYVWERYRNIFIQIINDPYVHKDGSLYDRTVQSPRPL
jgi:hypothetical protein